MVMANAEWERWCNAIGAQVDGNRATVDGRTVENREDELVVDDQVFEPELVVPKGDGLEIHEGDEVHLVQLTEPDRDGYERRTVKGDRVELLVHEDVSLSSTKEKELQMALDDIRAIETSLYIDVKVVLTPYEDDVSGSCGEFKDPNEIWVVPSETSPRGYSDYRWRVNKTLHGVIVHELGHYVDLKLLRNTHVPSFQIRDVFSPKTDITNYSDVNDRENFAESFRVYVTNPNLLRIISEEKYEWFEQFFSVPERDMEEAFQDYSGIIQKQLREASTNKHIRKELDFIE